MAPNERSSQDVAEQMLAEAGFSPHDESRAEAARPWPAVAEKLATFDDEDAFRELYLRPSDEPQPGAKTIADEDRPPAPSSEAERSTSPLVTPTTSPGQVGGETTTGPSDAWWADEEGEETRALPPASQSSPGTASSPVTRFVSGLGLTGGTRLRLMSAAFVAVIVMSGLIALLVSARGHRSGSPLPSRIGPTSVAPRAPRPRVERARTARRAVASRREVRAPGARWRSQVPRVASTRAAGAGARVRRATAVSAPRVIVRRAPARAAKAPAAATGSRGLTEWAGEFTP